VKKVIWWYDSLEVKNGIFLCTNMILGHIPSSHKKEDGALSFSDKY
jgi:hypothetical protein